jgi:hypothetical protein
MEQLTNTFTNRYGWHFPEMAKIVSEGLLYSKVVLKTRLRSEMKNMDLSEILQDEQVEERLKQAAEISMGTEMSEEDLVCVCNLAEQVRSLLCGILFLLFLPSLEMIRLGPTADCLLLLGREKRCFLSCLVPTFVDILRLHSSMYVSHLFVTCFPCLLN